MANQGWTDKSAVWVGTEAGSVGDGTGTGKTNTNTLTIKTIVFATKLTDDKIVVYEGTDTYPVLTLEGPNVVDFGPKGKRFSGLYVHSITAGAAVYIYTL